jgi:hypothetical protein
VAGTFSINGLAGNVSDVKVSAPFWSLHCQAQATGNRQGVDMTLDVKLIVAQIADVIRECEGVLVMQGAKNVIGQLRRDMLPLASCSSRSETEPFSRPNRATGVVAAWSYGGMLWGSDG